MIKKFDIIKLIFYKIFLKNSCFFNKKVLYIKNKDIISKFKEALKWDLIWVLISHGAYGTTGLKTN
ncbi:unnamed protein product [marine sediment metagenome]|uniref:Uncharacterized protein n=1 Tax=marine sediment metagenome TaxID=412755 RepID=X1PFX8_9ZZZZ